MLSLSKLIGFLIMPAGLVWLGLLLAPIWAFQQRRKGFALALFALCLAYTLAGNPALGRALMARLEHRIPPLPPEAPPFEAVFVLGGGSEEGPEGLPQLSEAGDRIAAAAALWHAGRTRFLVASGASDDSLRGPRDAGKETEALWRRLGIPGEAILRLERPCRITREEVAAYAELKRQRGWTRVGLLSSAWHLPRALRLARRAGLEVTPIPADFRGRPERFQLWHLVPQADGFQQVQLACWEWLGAAAGR